MCGGGFYFHRTLRDRINQVEKRTRGRVPRNGDELNRRAPEQCPSKLLQLFHSDLRLTTDYCTPHFFNTVRLWQIQFRVLFLLLDHSVAILTHSSCSPKCSCEYTLCEFESRELLTFFLCRFVGTCGSPEFAGTGIVSERPGTRDRQARSQQAAPFQPPHPAGPLQAAALLNRWVDQNMFMDVSKKGTNR